MVEKYFDINDVGINIRSKLYCNNPRNIHRVVLSCHGFGGGKENHATKKIAESLLSQYDDLAVIAFDWPCHGKDVKQRLSLKDCDDYLATVIRYVKDRMHVDDIYMQATSFGGYLTLKYISEHENPFKKIALRCPAVNMRDILTKKVLTEEQLEQIAKGKVVEVGFERKIKITKQLLDEFEKSDIRQREYYDSADDIIIMQGTRDELVPFDEVKAFCENNVIDFYPIEGADHRYQDPAKLRECINHINEFFRSSLEAGKQNQ